MRMAVAEGSQLGPLQINQIGNAAIIIVMERTNRGMLAAE
jgi:predicted protein tyrosine phosphatase